jgi:DNA topoisomerase-1
MPVGNEEYAKTNKSFGLTTLRRRHLKVAGSTLTFDFRAKHGIAWHVELKDRRLANIMRRLQDIRGQDLFKYLDDQGVEHNVGSDDVNDYLREITGEEITAKDFRTWAATNLAALALRDFEACDTAAKPRRMCCAPSSRWPRCRGIPPASAGNATFIQQYSRGIWMAPCWRGSRPAPMNSLTIRHLD